MMAEPDDSPLSDPCPLCSNSSTHVFHGAGDRCDRDPRRPANVIAAHFKQHNPKYVGIVWEAIGNGAVHALEDAGYVIVEPTCGDVDWAVPPGVRPIRLKTYVPRMYGGRDSSSGSGAAQQAAPDPANQPPSSQEEGS